MCIVGEALVINLTWDDSFIFYRYASNLVDGYGLVYNPGEYVEGFSSLAWITILAGCGVASLDIPLAARWLGILLAIGSVVLVFRAGRQLAPESLIVGGLAVVLLATRFDFAIYAHAGMETSLMTFLVTLGFVLYTLRLDLEQSLLAVGFVAGLVSLTRPEGVIFAAGLVLTELTRVNVHQMRRHVKRLVPLVLPTALMLVGYTIWRYSYYGDLLPNTYYAKVSDLEPVLVARGVFHLMKFFIFGGGIAYWVPFLIFATVGWKKVEIRAMLVLIGLFAMFTVYTTGDWFPYGRFMQPVLPILIIGTAGGLRLIQQRLNMNLAVLTLVTAFFILSGNQNALRRNMEPAGEAFVHRDSVAVWTRLGRLFGEIKGHVPDLTVAAYPIGAIGYYSSATIIDMHGLTDRHIARNGVRLRGFVSHERADTRYVLERRPDILYFGGERLDGSNQIIPAIMEFAPQFHNILPYTESEIIGRILSTYEFCKLADIGGFWVRRDSPCYQICDSLKRQY
jgi:arabinofuranosyltransferase